MPGRVRLRIVDGPMKGREFVFDGHDNFLFGRDADCHIRMPNDSFVSRHHFIIEAAPPDMRLRDLGSMNGTYVNEELRGARRAGEAPEDAAHRIFPSVDLKSGDRIHVGETVLDVQVESPDGATETVRFPICALCGIAAPRDLGGPEGTYFCGSCRERARDDPKILPEFLKTMDEEPLMMADSI